MYTWDIYMYMYLEYEFVTLLYTHTIWLQFSVDNG